MKLSEEMRTEGYQSDDWRRVAKLEEENEALRETIKIDWEVIVDAIDDHDIKQSVIRLWNRADALLTGGDDESE